MFFRKERFTCSMYIVLLWKEIKIEQNFFLDILLFSIMTCPVLCFGNLFDLAVSYFAKINSRPTVVNYLHLPVIMPLNVIDAWFSIPYHDPYSSDIDACKSSSLQHQCFITNVSDSENMSTVCGPSVRNCDIFINCVILVIDSTRFRI